MSFVGVDACKTGWIAVELAVGERPVAHYLRHISDVAASAPRAQVIAIDIPIGLPAAARRSADVEAKSLLGARRSSVFLTPPRVVLEAPTHATATKLSVELTGVGISQQAFALRSRIFEVDEWLPSAPCRVVEIHPEVSFARMLGGPAAASKKTWAGMIERSSVLRREGISLDDVGGVPARMAYVDDMLDAGAAAWSAHRVFNGTALRLPEAVPAGSPTGPTIWA